MPYSSNSELPPAVRDRYSERCQTTFRKAFNNAVGQRAGGSADEASAFRIAHSAANNCMESSKRSPLAMTDMTVKFAEGSDTIIEGYGVPFGLDLDGQQFTAKSDLCGDWFPNGGRPILYQHGFDKTVKMAAVGHEVESEMRDDGLWVRAELDKASKYYNRVKQLVEAGAVGWSSAAPDHKVKVSKDGHIDLWPVVEFSLTPTPAKPNLVAYAMKSSDAVSLFEATGTEIPEQMADIEQTPTDSVPESLADHSEQVLAGMKAWVERMEERSDFRMKVGRELSRANIEALRTAYQTIGALLEKADKPDEDEQRAKDARKAFADYLRLEAELAGMKPD